MKKFLFYLEILWIMAIVASVLVFIWNLWALRSLSPSVYTPIITGVLSGVVLWNIKGQRKFYERADQEKQSK